MTIDVQRPTGGYPLVVVKEDRDLVPIVGFGDLHVGSPNYDERQALKTRDFIETTEAAWFGMGDYGDNGMPGAPGTSWMENTIKPTEQLIYLEEFFRPIAHLCIGLIIGNHEERTKKTTGLDIINVLSHNLHVPYLGYELYAKVCKERENAYTIYANHSTSAPKTAGLALNFIERDWRWAHFDIIAKAHDHSMGFDQIPYVEVDKTSEIVRDRVSYALLTGHYLRKPNSYNAKAGRAPKPCGTVALWLDLKSRARTVKPEYIV